MVLVAALAAGCASHSPSSTTSGASPAETHEVHGYPIDRSLEALANWRDLDIVVMVRNVTYQKAVKLSRVANGFPAVVTPASATVVRSIYGHAKAGQTLNTLFAGGDTGALHVTASEELAPNRDAVAKSPLLVIAGEMKTTPDTGSIVEPLFVYRLDKDGRLTSLLESGGARSRPVFTLKELSARLAERSQRTR
ncbi:hypothetical protein ACWEOW_18285 [Monashia sp. NPDC004114]